MARDFSKMSTCIRAVARHIYAIHYYATIYVEECAVYDAWEGGRFT